MKFIESSEATPEVFCKKKVFLELSQNSLESNCARASFLILAQVFSCEFYEISKSTFSAEHLRTTASKS